MATKEQLRTILMKHRGIQNAIRVKTLAEIMDTDERRVRMLKRELADEMLIGSSCAARQSGYFIPETSEEIERTIAQYYSRIRELFALIKATKGTPEMIRFMSQLQLEFGGEPA